MNYSNMPQYVWMDLGNINEKSKSQIITCYDTLYKVKNTLFKILNLCNNTKQNGGAGEMMNVEFWMMVISGQG